jgi:Tryptophan-associated transmembrane protein (Trp_oprn_chp)
VKTASRLLLLAGAAGVVVSTFLPWVRIQGAPINLGLIGVRVSPGGTTVRGTETSAWPILVAVAAVIAVLTLLNMARKLLVLFGLLVVAGGGGLLYYVLNVVDIETAGRTAIERAVAGAAVTSSAEAGPFLLLASGVCILIGALKR